jgi:hypothetical protein
MTVLAGTVRVPGGAAGDVTKQDAEPVPPALVVTRLDSLPAGGEARESLRLLDPTPLFMPNARGEPASFSSGELVERPSGGVTESAPAVLLFSEARPAKDLLRPSLPASPLEAARAVASSRWFNGLARVDAGGGTRSGINGATAGRGRMDVYTQGASGRLATIELPSDPVLEADFWQPVELRVLIGAAGAVSWPVVITGSGAGEIDEHVQLLVKQELLPRLRLRPGAYHLVVGP